MSNLVQKGYKKISPFFIPYAITNMGGALLAIDQVRTLPLAAMNESHLKRPQRSASLDPDYLSQREWPMVAAAV